MSTKPNNHRNRSTIRRSVRKPRTTANRSTVKRVPLDSRLLAFILNDFHNRFELWRGAYTVRDLCEYVTQAVREDPTLGGSMPDEIKRAIRWGLAKFAREKKVVRLQLVYETRLLDGTPSGDNDFTDGYSTPGAEGNLRASWGAGTRHVYCKRRGVWLGVETNPRNWEGGVP